VPSLVLPLSTDQFAGAAALEAAGYAEVLDPNAASPEQIRDAVLRLRGLSGIPRTRLDELSGRLTATPGPVGAREALLPAAATVSRSSP